ncbi:Interferon-induced GTP-binding protein Mx3 [Colletotrichum spinosum]|uniref:Interferon-induced GTP-binding protein Mx3 n=1 Tax=Colletotrichum spinosum TaxID=1347390 RepID=A0A4R8QQX6_9PEZI|nr:Interferon-induced GTP-binding protein Mx3 [Colletotrichum spinosum]
MGSISNRSALEELNRAETRALFDAVDKLSSLGVGEIVHLPQIIVAGDQSAGKSSVLEAISHVHFPAHEGVCTRFATELVLRPSTHPSIEATVQFADTSRPPHSLQVSGLDAKAVKRVINEAKEQMGLSDADGGFSKDVLRLKIQGPDMCPLTLVDLPGIFHTTAATQSFKDPVTVSVLVESYMRKSNSIILAVISANNQLANQTVMERAKANDPAKVRTLGVITKPDLLPRGSSSEAGYLHLVQGRENANQLALGWHVLRNRAEPEEDPGPRDSVEDAFFASSAWSSIPTADRGITNLRTKLGRLLLDHVKKSLPSVLDDIQDKLSRRELELKRLGQPRPTPRDMRAYLVEIAEKFQRLVHDGICGRYTDSFFGGSGGTRRKLRSQLRNHNRALQQFLSVSGASQRVVQYTFQPPQQPPCSDYLKGYYEAYSRASPSPKIITWSELSAELEHQAAANQGTELPGFINMNLIIQLFQKQAQPWERIAETHLKLVTGVAESFVEEALEHTVGRPGSESTTGAILSDFVDPFFQGKERLLADKLEELLRPFKEGFAFPLDSEFHEALEMSKADKKAASVLGTLPPKSQEKILFSVPNKSEFSTDRVVKTMQIFYDMALRTFTENLINLAVESCLVQDLPAIFTPKMVSSVSDEKLAELAAEPEEVLVRRRKLNEDIGLLREGRDLCRRHKPRAAASRKSDDTKSAAGLRDDTTGSVVPSPSAKVTVPAPQGSSSTTSGLFPEVQRASLATQTPMLAAARQARSPASP